jgi:hypothetical protein
MKRLGPKVQVDNPPPPTPGPSQANETEAPYLSLAKQLSNDIATLKHLHKQRDFLLKEEAEITARRARVSNEIFEARQTSNDIGMLKTELQVLQNDKEVVLAQLESANDSIDQSELALHTLVPLASQTIHRLYVAGFNHITA